MATGLKLIVTESTASTFADIAISDGQLIFIRDLHKIALDYEGERTFYNSIETLSTEAQRVNLESPIEGHFYFILETAVLYYYKDGTWTQATSAPSDRGDLVNLGEKPEVGVKGVLYVDKVNQNISVWDDETEEYVEVGNVNKADDEKESISDNDILSLFS